MIEAGLFLALFIPAGWLVWRCHQARARDRARLMNALRRLHGGTRFEEYRQEDRET